MKREVFNRLPEANGKEGTYAGCRIKLDLLFCAVPVCGDRSREGISQTVWQKVDLSGDRLSGSRNAVHAKQEYPGRR